MATDRSIRLDVSVPDLGARSGDGLAAGQRQGQPDAQARQRFEQALADAPAGQTSDVPQAPRPFSLFSAVSVPGPCADPELPRRLDEMLDRLMVDDGAAGRKQVRMDLKDEHLPGLSVVIQEADGRLQVDFICSVETTRLRLNAAVPQQAPLLAQRLQRDVLMRVQTDDEEDACLFEVVATA